MIKPSQLYVYTRVYALTEVVGQYCAMRLPFICFHFLKTFPCNFLNFHAHFNSPIFGFFLIITFADANDEAATLAFKVFMKVFACILISYF